MWGEAMRLEYFWGDKDGEAHLPRDCVPRQQHDPRPPDMLLRRDLVLTMASSRHDVPAKTVTDILVRMPQN